MKNTVAILLALSLTGANLGCATIRRHPVVSGIIIGAAAGVTIGLATRHTCPKVIDGTRYDGTPPCPKYWPEPGSRKK